LESVALGRSSNPWRRGPLPVGFQFHQARALEKLNKEKLNIYMVKQGTSCPRQTVPGKEKAIRSGGQLLRENWESQLPPQSGFAEGEPGKKNSMGDSDRVPLQKGRWKKRTRPPAGPRGLSNKRMLAKTLSLSKHGKERFRKKREEKTGWKGARPGDDQGLPSVARRMLRTIRLS